MSVIASMRLVFPLLVMLAGCGSSRPPQEPPPPPPPADASIRPSAMTCHQLARKLAKERGETPESYDNDGFIDVCTERWTNEMVECGMTTFAGQGCFPMY